MRGGRAVGLLALVGGGLLLLALSRAWAVVGSVPDAVLAPPRERLAGSALAPGALACAYLGLASLLALVATRGWARVALGAVIAGAGVGALVDVLPLTRKGSLSRRALEHVAGCDRAGCSGDRVVHAASLGWPWLAAVGGALLLVAGGLTLLHGRRWGGLGSSYEAPGAVVQEPQSEKAVWDALDRGEDPTA